MTRTDELMNIFKTVDERVKDLAVYTAIIVSVDSILNTLQYQFACFQSYGDAKEWLELQYHKYSKITPVQCYLDDEAIFF